MARLLTSLGIPCGHEAFFNTVKTASISRVQGELFPENSHASTHNVVTGEKLSEWVDEDNLIADSSYLAAPLIDHEALKDVKVVHVVRNPIKVVSSFVYDIHFFSKENERELIWREYVKDNLPGVDINTTNLKDEINAAAYYWIHWNQMIEQKSADREYFRLQVEDGCTAELLDFLNVKEKPVQVFSNKRINSWRGIDDKGPQSISIDHITDLNVQRQFVELAREYGYLFKSLL
jgi:hypothetical protein